MSKSTKWVPKNDTVGVPGKGFIRKDAFSDADLKALKARAKNRGIDEHGFLLSVGLVPVNGEFKLELDQEDDGLEVDGNGNVIEKKEVEKKEQKTGTPDDTWTAKEIKAWLAEKGVDVPSSLIKKADLLEEVSKVSE